MTWGNGSGILESELNSVLEMFISGLGMHLSQTDVTGRTLITSFSRQCRIHRLRWMHVLGRKRSYSTQHKHHLGRTNVTIMSYMAQTVSQQN